MSLHALYITKKKKVYASGNSLKADLRLFIPVTIQQNCRLVQIETIVDKSTFKMESKYHLR